jgi:hypothetical protein
MMRTVLFAALISFGVVGSAVAMYESTEAEAQRRFRLRQTPAPQESPKAAPQVAEGPLRDRLRERVLLAVVKSRVVRQLQADGFKVAGGPAKPMTRAEAEALYDRLTEDVILGAVKEASPQTFAAATEPGGFLARLIAWITEHQDEIAAIVKLILSILALL